MARAALLGARGNSGVILSQLIRGAAEELISRPGELVDPVLIGAAMARAADRAYGSVREPAEGTILTVVREMAAPGRDARSRTWTQPRLPERVDADAPERDDRRGARARARRRAGSPSSAGPTCSPVLREAGVVDAGGYGLTIIFAGVIAALRGAEPPELDHHAPARVTHPQHESSTYRYCTNFAVTGEDARRRRLDRAPLEALGDSVLVVGDRTHAEGPRPHRRPGARHRAVRRRRRGLAPRRGRHARAGRRSAATRLAASRSRRCGALAVVAGAGMRELFEALGAVRARRRADAEPVDLRAAGRHPRGARRGGRGAAELARTW